MTDDFFEFTKQWNDEATCFIFAAIKHYIEFYRLSPTPSSDGHSYNISANIEDYDNGKNPMSHQLRQVQSRKTKRPRFRLLRVRQLDWCSKILSILEIQRRQTLRERRMVLRYDDYEETPVSGQDPGLMQKPKSKKFEFTSSPSRTIDRTPTSTTPQLRLQSTV